MSKKKTATTEAAYTTLSFTEAEVLTEIWAAQLVGVAQRALVGLSHEALKDVRTRLMYHGLLKHGAGNIELTPFGERLLLQHQGAKLIEKPAHVKTWKYSTTCARCKLAICIDAGPSMSPVPFDGTGWRFNEKTLGWHCPNCSA